MAQERDTQTLHLSAASLSPPLPPCRARRARWWWWRRWGRRCRAAAAEGGRVPRPAGGCWLRRGGAARRLRERSREGGRERAPVRAPGGREPRSTAAAPPPVPVVGVTSPLRCDAIEGERWGEASKNNPLRRGSVRGGRREHAYPAGPPRPAPASGAASSVASGSPEDPSTAAVPSGNGEQPCTTFWGSWDVVGDKFTLPGSAR